MITILINGFYYLVAFTTEMSVASNLGHLHWPMLAVAILSVAAGLVIGMLNALLLMALPAITKPLETEPANDPFGNQIPSMDLIVNYSAISILGWFTLPTFISARARHNLPPLDTPLWSDYVAFFWLVLALLLYLLFQRYGIKYDPAKEAEMLSVANESNDRLRLELSGLAAELADLIETGTIDEEETRFAPRSVYASLEYGYELLHATGFISSASFCRGNHEPAFEYTVRQPKSRKTLEKAAEWPEVVQALRELSATLERREPINNALIRAARKMNDEK
jgi:hypothetical protein